MSSDFEASSVVDIETVRFSVIDRTTINDLVKTKNKRCLRDHGGVESILLALETDSENGIIGHTADMSCRRKAFGSNLYRTDKPSKTFYRFILEALRDPMILILLVCVFLSIGFGIKKHGIGQGWYRGGTVLVAILVAVTVSAGTKFWPTRQSHELSEANNNIAQVDVVRSGEWKRISIAKIVVGDVVFLKPGDQVPAHGLFLSGFPLKVETWDTNGHIYGEEIDGSDNPFLVSGTYVVEGYARMVVTAVSSNEKKGHTIGLDGELQKQYKEITSEICTVGLAAAALILLVLCSRDRRGNWVSIVREMNNRGVLMVTVENLAPVIMMAATSTSEGLLSAAKTVLAYSMKRRMANCVLVRKPSVCHHIGLVNTICTNGTGILTQHSMEVKKFWLGLSSTEEVLPNLIAPNILELLHQAIGLNTSESPLTSLSVPPDSCEKSIFDWAVRQMEMDIQALKGSFSILETEYFGPENRQSGVLIRNNTDNTFQVHRKGAPNIIIPMCSYYYEISGIVKVVDGSVRMLMDQMIEGMTENGLRCIAFAHRNTAVQDYFTVPHQPLILLGLVGLTNNCRIGVRKAVEDCRSAGVNLKMITQDNMLTARAIATDCGIIEAEAESGLVVEAIEFRNYTQEERIVKADNIRVMVNATPFDKFLMVQCLKKKGHVAVIGSGIEDAKALREADIGICFGTQGAAEITKACSDIVIKDENFPAIVEILWWGRGIYDSFQMHTQFMLTGSFVALVTDFVNAVLPTTPGSNAMADVSMGNVPYPAFQLIWVKLIMDTFAVVVLGRKRPLEELMHKPPRAKDERLITGIMRGKIWVEAFFQTAFLIRIHFDLTLDANTVDTIIFNTYVLYQVFAMFFPWNAMIDCCEMPYTKWFMGFIRGVVACFFGILPIAIVFQVLIVEVLNRIAGTTKLTWVQWDVCIFIAFISGAAGSIYLLLMKKIRKLEFSGTYVFLALLFLARNDPFSSN